MARDTNRNNIKPVLLSIAFVMMVMLCLFTTKTQQVVKVRHFSYLNSIINSRLSLSFLWVGIIIFIICCTRGNFTSIAMKIFEYSKFPFFCISISQNGCFCRICFVIGLPINLCAQFTLRATSLFCLIVSMEFRKCFDFLAFVASFCYSCFRHGFCSFNSEKLCLEPLQAQYLCGSLYCIAFRGDVK